MSSQFKISRAQELSGKKQRSGRNKEWNRSVAANSSSILSTEGSAFRPHPPSSTSSRCPRRGERSFFFSFFWRIRCLVSFCRSLNLSLLGRGSKSARMGALRVWIDGRPIMRLNLNGIIASRTELFYIMLARIHSCMWCAWGCVLVSWYTRIRVIGSLRNILSAYQLPCVTITTINSELIFIAKAIMW